MKFNYFFAFSLVLIGSVLSLNAQSWQPLSSEEPNNDVRTLAVDGSGNVYLGGSFTSIGSNTIEKLAKFNGSNWSAVGGGLPLSNTSVQDIESDASGNVYVANGYFEFGCFCLVYYIHKWNGTSWTLVGEVYDASISKIEVNAAGHIYAMGDFNSISGVSANKIAYFDGTNWQAMGAGIGTVGSMELLGNGDLYVANTTSAGGQSCSLAKWTGSAWTVLSTDNFNASVLSMEEGASGDLYVAGTFTMVGSLSANRVAKWNGTSWSALGTGLDGLCQALLFDNGNLYAGGTFTEAGGCPQASSPNGTAPLGRPWTQAYRALRPR